MNYNSEVLRFESINECLPRDVGLGILNLCRELWDEGCLFTANHIPQCSWVEIPYLSQINFWNFKLE